MGRQSENNNLKKTRASSYPLETKIFNINYIVVN